jgi:hypothetical protein
MHDDLFQRDWITTFVTTRDLLRRDATPTTPTPIPTPTPTPTPAPAPTTADPTMTAPYNSWDRPD